VTERSPRVAFRTLGCKVNRVESEMAAARLLGEGWATADPDAADVVVVNTCTVTGDADAKARKEVRRALALSGEPVVIVTGCLAAVDAEGLRALGERVVVAPDRDDVAASVASAVGRTCDTPPARVSAPGPVRPSAHDADFRTRAMLKIQDGCDARCAYCIVPAARGLPRSRPLAEITAEARALADTGVGEFVVTGINVGRYEDAGSDLADVIAALAQVGPRVRLSSVEPLDLTDRLLGVMADAAAGERFCAHLHVPLQSGSDALLSAMGRGYDTAGFADAIARARAALPGLAVTMDVIAGLPGETDTDARTTIAFIRGIAPQRLHVFRYSMRHGTRAADMPQVDPRVRAARSRELRDLSEELFATAVEARLGTTARALIERPDGTGTTEDHLSVRVTPAPRVSELVDVRLVAREDGVIFAERVATAEASS
jgi:threonylcarbamoyladenosine tRNA methylthiotransferase MtaB